MNKTLILIFIVFVGLIHNASAQLSFGLSAGGALSPYKTTNITSTPNILFVKPLFESTQFRFDANVSYAFKNKWFVGLHYGQMSNAYSYSMINKDLSSSFSFGFGSDFISHLYSSFGKLFKAYRWNFQPYLGLGYRWYPKSSFLDLNNKIVSTGNASVGLNNVSLDINDTLYIFPKLFLPLGIDINYYIYDGFRVSSRLEYQHGFNAPFFKGEVKYKEFLFPDQEGFGIIEKTNVFSLNLGIVYTFEKLTIKNKPRKTLKKDI